MPMFERNLLDLFAEVVVYELILLGFLEFLHGGFLFVGNLFQICEEDTVSFLVIMHGLLYIFFEVDGLMEDQIGITFFQLHYIKVYRI